ncbi:M56 family metallopeptidase [Flagellimonas zhangzhouensis]|uniref:Signal transducer regulating beta-lactamase production, contains metallopeptidase domain n=1 Tax=Flagellimonas zhangzhouensis TaxID=1073328 RepID=A0A1H2WQ58_9FLAO|nr:M56 family metallopeptidase [Allomuricauda zhangzhouensis]SDQ23494.1 Signal transducer regulating beta-lactamase production, contains metallopeptidase domain [Allomuricauda zhangzhouensis]SDW82638.1 Signal transducer regulating beta-lactamase production, contains metallopeptidase domain [Allomuricauda zhangzhouensis]
MLPFILKSTACLAIFLAFYKLVLENENMHHFKRFYLIGALLAALIIPNIVFVEYVEVAQSATILHPVTDINDAPQPLVETADTEWSEILWGIYALGVVVFAIRFFKNLGQIGYRIRKNPKLKQQSTTRVLMGQPIPPHTFFSYIFLNKRQYEDHNIPEEVLLHEETHAKQKHSLDILLIEMAQVIFWFNPLIYFLKYSIKLNHEFLADQAVVNRSQDRAQYQNTLLSYLSHDSFETHQSIGIANAINYSSIKKRFTVMKTNTSKTSFVLRSFLLLPLTALLLFGFSSSIEVPKNSDIENDPAPIEIQADNSGSEVFFNKNNTQTINPIEIQIDKNGKLWLQSKEVSITDLSDELEKLNGHLTFDERKNIIRSIVQVEANTPKAVISKIDKALAEYGSATINILGPKETPQQSASREEMKAYNKLAKKYNAMDRNNMAIQKKEVMRLKEIYGKMSKKQREDAEPFPDFPPPPPAPGSPKAPKPTKEVIEVNPNNPPVPPAPPAPPKPIEHVKEMAQKGASFTYNGKAISAKEAIEVVQKNQHINIDAREANGANPVVKISTDPIVIEN